MTAPTDTENQSSKAFFLLLEQCLHGDIRPLPELVARLPFNEKGLLPVIAQEAHSNEILMLAYMNREALQRTLESRQMTYFSRSRSKLWVKGSTSGHYQHLVDISFDCDGDAILCRVEQQGGACHTGRRSCFYLAADLDRDQVRIMNSPAQEGPA